MLKFSISGKRGDYDLNLPSRLDEITPDYLLDVTDDVHIADNYVLIAVCYKERLSSVMLANQKKKNLTTAAVPLFVKTGKCENEFVNSIKTGEKIIIAPTQVALGHHVTAPTNLITMNSIITLAEGDSNIYTEALKVSEDCYFVEFKLVPACDINGVYKSGEPKLNFNPFVTKKNVGGN